MEHSQSRQYERRPIRRVTKKRSGLVRSWKILIYGLMGHPGLLFTGLLAILIGIASLAWYTLVNVGSKEQVERPEILAVVAKPMTRSSQKNNPTPLWIVGAIALSCASGCLIILRLVNGEVLTVYKPTYKPITSPTREVRNLNSSPMVVVPLAPAPQESDSLETVLPSEDMQPLDKRQKILAQLMDIRQKNSWSAILLSKSHPGSEAKNN